MDIRGFVKQGGSVISTDRKADVNTVLRELNRFEGINISNCRVKTIEEIAFELVCADSALKGEDFRKQIADNDTCKSFMYAIIRDNPPGFLPESAVSFDSAAEILRVVKNLRANNKTSKYDNSTDSVISDLKHLISLYEKSLKDHGYIDDVMLINIANDILIRLKDNGDSGKKLSFILPWCKYHTGKMILSEQTKNVETFISLLLDYYNEKPDDIEYTSPVKATYKFFKGFGFVNEVRHVISEISDNKLNFGDTAIIYGGGEYESVLQGQFEAAFIPYVFVSGYHASADPHVSFMLEALRFAKEDYSFEQLKQIILNPSIKIEGLFSDDIYKYYSKILGNGIGWGRKRYISFLNRTDSESRDDKDLEKRNKFKGFLRDLIEALPSDENGELIKEPGIILKNLLELTDKYTSKSEIYQKYIRESIENRSVSLKGAGIKDDTVQLLSDYLTGLTVSEKADTGKISIMPYSSCTAIDRKNIFVIGLQRENVEKTVAESPVLPDKELYEIAEGFIDDAAGQNRRRRIRFETSLKLSSPEKIWMSYNGYDTVNFLDNAPSMLFGDFKNAPGNREEEIKPIGYGIGKGAVKITKDDFEKAWTSVEKEVSDEDDNTDKEANDNLRELVHMSASSLQTMLYCPLLYHYQKNKYIPEDEQLERKGHSWLGAKDKGNLFHHTMEEYGKKTLEDNEVSLPDYDILEECFEHQSALMLNELPAPSEDIMNREKQEVYDVIKRYTEYMHQTIAPYKVVKCEAGFENVNYKDIAFRGSADRVDGFIKDGVLHLDIIDYKTGDPVKKKEEIDTNKQIQHFVYPAGVVSWVNENKELLEKRFGESFNEIIIDDVRYEFPYEWDGAKPGMISVKTNLDSVDANIREKGTIAFPNNVEEAVNLIIEYHKNDFDQVIVKFEKLALNRFDADELNIELTDKSCVYCRYKDICRLRLKLMFD